MAQDILQTSAWANVRAKQGHIPVWLDEALMLIKPIHTLFRSFGVMSQVDGSTLNLDLVQQAATDQYLSHVQIDPNNIRTQWEFSPEQIKKYHLVPTGSLFPRHTVLIDLNQSEEVLLANLRKKTRRFVRTALDANVLMRDESTPAGLEIFYELYSKTVNVKGFLGRNFNYMHQVWDELSRVGKARIFITYYQDIPLSARMVFLHDGVIYNAYAGNARAHSEVCAAYGAMWQLILWGKLNGYHTMNMWGVNPHAKEGDSDYGFTLFKTGFGGEVVELAPAYDMVVDKFSYYSFKYLNNLRLFALKAKRKLVG
jgi:lipid II:glycine glycyltransferase (peptidoglycan interpeptide bridge formation enzyme)